METRSSKRVKTAAAAGSLVNLFDDQRKGQARVADQPDKENVGGSSGAARNGGKGTQGLGENGRSVAAERSVEDIYQKKTQLEHILLRPDSYVGSTEKQHQEQWVMDPSSNQMVRKNLEYAPALYKIYDEILVNAADNLVRSPDQDAIRVEVDVNKGCISVMNNGQGLPVQMHREHQCYVLELVFGHLLTSDNYDDSEKKVTGGRNGYGAKLTNIFSSKFIIEAVDSRAKKHYRQVWEKNMTHRNDPVIRSQTSQEVDYTKVTFYPDWKRFQMTGFEDDIALLMRRRAYDVAASTHGRCKVFLDGERIEVTSFMDYVGLYMKPDNFRVCEEINDRWEVAVGITDGAGFQQVSFVNSIHTVRGGTHVNYLSDQLVNAVMEKVSKQKTGTLPVKPQHVKGYLSIFVNCLIENPAFDSQTKETLTSRREKFGSTAQLPESLLTAVVECGIVESLMEWSKAMGKSELAQHLNRSDCGMQKRLFGIPKLEDANKAGTKDGPNCTLILTEGDSAKSLAVSGLSIVGRDHYGVFPLRGKLRNVRDLTVKQMLENKEIESLMKIMALDASKSYEDAKGLRYGSIMIMTDQDYDGSHIKGLIINFIQHWFPSLLRLPGFLQEFVTPIVKVTKGDETHTFFTVPDYEAWKEQNNDGVGWKSKYYKGLGTSTNKEAKEYFSDLEQHQLQFSYTNEEDDDLVDMAFNSKRADDRKLWIAACDDSVVVDHTQAELSYNDFINKELVLFARYDVQRAVPCVIDGFKPGQRKVLFSMIKRRSNQETKVAQFSGYVSEHSAYHHGEVSLQGTIINLAQTFVGSNNVNLLLPKGQFGTRIMGGKDHAAARYIFTKPSRTMRAIFSEEDDPVLEYQSEEGMTIEPKWYCPVIPLVLVNGAEGIGTGWSTSIPNYNPRDIIAALRGILNKTPTEPMIPWYRGFKGSIQPIAGNPGKYEVTGVAAKRGRVKLEITELPVKKWTQEYKEWLLDQLPKGNEERRALVTEIREYHSENAVHFVLSMTPDKLSEAEDRGFEKVFHLRGSISTTNMWAFDVDGNIQKYETPEDIIQAFVPVRMEIYAKRKEYLLKKLRKELAVISNRLKFIEMVVADKLIVEKRKSAELCNEMHKKGLQTMSEINGGKPVKEDSPDGYKYLLSMKMWTLTEDKLRSLQGDHDKKSQAVKELEARTLENFWAMDLDRLEAALDACDAEDAKEAEAAAKLARKNLDAEEDSLVNRQCVIVLDSNFGAKRVRSDQWKTKRKLGSSLKSGTSVIKKKVDKQTADKQPTAEGEDEDAEEEAEQDALAGVFCCHDFDALLVFSEDGVVFKLQALDIPLAKKMNSPATPLKDFLPEVEERRISAMATIPHGSLRDAEDFIVLLSKNGFIKKVALDKFKALKGGKGAPCFKLAEGDELKWAHRASPHSALVLGTSQGYVSRISLGLEFAASTTKGAGKPAMKMKMVGDFITACAVANLTKAEIAACHARKETARLKRLANAEKQNETTDATKCLKEADSAQVNCPSRRNNCDDDDSDNSGAEKAVEAKDEDSDAEDQADAAMAVDGDDKEGTGDKEGRDEKNDENDIPGDLDLNEQCALLVSSQGFGLRMHLTSRCLKLRRRGGAGLKGMKCGYEEGLCGVSIVSSTISAKQPAKPRTALQLFVADDQAKLAAEQAAKTQQEETGEVTGGDSTSLPVTSEQAQDPLEKLNALTPEQLQHYEDRAQEDIQRYEAAIEEFNAMPDEEEVLLGCKSGLITRVKVGTVPIVHRPGRGRILVKLKRGDLLSAVSLLSSAEVQEEGGTDASGPKPPASKPVVRTARGRRLPRPAQAGSSLSQVAEGTAIGASPGDVSKRVRGKRPSDAAASLRSRLSHLSPWPRAPTSGQAMRLSAQRNVRLSIVKPRLRLLSRTRKSLIVRSMDIDEWSALAGAAAGASQSFR